MMSFITSMACYVVLSHAVGAQSVEMGQVLHVQLKVDVSIFIKSGQIVVCGIYTKKSEMVMSPKVE